MPLNLSTFPLVPYPGRAPELAPRSGMGGWPPYAMLAPADRLLPFVLSRARVVGAPPWVNCARFEHADTGEPVAELTPTGPGVAVPALGLRLDKYEDVPAGAEHFVYAGGIVPGLALPCGVPLRLVLDNDWQSPRFLARPDVAEACLLAEWWHERPLYGVPYGRGLRQRLYIESAAVQFAAPTTKKEVTADASTGQERVDFLAKVRAGTVATEALPDYLAEALSAAEAHSHFTLDGEPWTVTEAKATSAGQDGGRTSFVLNLEQTDVLVRRNCPAPLLAASTFSPTMVRAWRCGDERDTDPDWQVVSTVCATDADGRNTGYQYLTEYDENPYSATTGTTRNRPSTAQDLVACPLPRVYPSAALGQQGTRNNCPPGSAGGVATLSLAEGAFTSIISQADADRQAAEYLAANLQDYVNANASCTPTGGGGSTVQWQPVYEPGGCFACQMVDAADPGNVRDATPAEASQYSRAYDNLGALCQSCIQQ